MLDVIFCDLFSLLDIILLRFTLVDVYGGNSFVFTAV